jgi:UDP-glucose 4-epimerase
MFPTLDRVYSNARARHELGWRPGTDFASVIERVAAGRSMETPLAEQVGRKGYHGEAFPDGIYPLG